MVLTSRDIYILKGRRNDVLRTYRSMDIEHILPLRFRGNRGNRIDYEGGLEDLGEFREGYCFKIENEYSEQWNICCDSLEEKVRWLQKIQELLRVETVDLVKQSQKWADSVDLALFRKEWGYREKKEGKEKNGYWVVIQDWSECSVICGGGY
jgi:hypothetical protein